jgi:hypothetical protein
MMQWIELGDHQCFFLGRSKSQALKIVYEMRDQVRRGGATAAV